MKVAVWIFSLLCISRVATGQDSAEAVGDYSFDLSSYEKSPIEYSLLFDVTPSLLIADSYSPLTRLRYPSLNNPMFDTWSLRSEGNLQFSKNWFAAYGAGTVGAGYFRGEDSLMYTLNLYEAYAKAASGSSLSFTAGKRNLKWGKGYVYSPVSLVSGRKDINDIEATLTGYWMAAAEYIKAFSGPLQTFAATMCILPIYGRINEGFADDRTGSLASQLYFLLFDTDLDVYGLACSDGTWSAGLDVSRNLLSNIEFHADFLHTSESVQRVFDSDSTSMKSTFSSWEALAGLRFLTPFSTTIILEYLHRSSGYRAVEMQAYHSALAFLVEQEKNDPVRKAVLRTSSEHYSGQFIMRNYLYMKLSQPDFLGIVYFSPSVYCLFNLDDFGCITGVELPYARFEHVSLLLRYVAFAGKADSEYGMKPYNHRGEIRIRVML
ncbi:MAG: hypothetical protein JW863_13160 [Chitinispirillaceae bacterium]|nr:hypothetical protein [Chitinispirillaceae bacterium]